MKRREFFALALTTLGASLAQGASPTPSPTPAPTPEAPSHLRVVPDSPSPSRMAATRHDYARLQ